MRTATESALEQKLSGLTGVDTQTLCAVIRIYAPTSSNCQSNGGELPTRHFGAFQPAPRIHSKVKARLDTLGHSEGHLLFGQNSCSL